MAGTKKRSILIIYTGGTIGMKTDLVTGALAPFDFSSIYDEFPSLRSMDIGVDVYPFEPIDSSNVDPSLWARLAEIIREKYDTYDGFVVLHGTDTMSFSASALSYALENLAKPVVFTGSQIPMGVMRTDGRENLITAIELAATVIEGRPAVPEVGLYFQNRLFRGNCTSKFSAEELGAFRSENYPALADVGVSIHFNKPFINTATSTGPLSISTTFDTNVIVIKIFPGIGRHALKAMLSLPGLRGVVLETYGSGNAPSEDWFINLLTEAIARGIIILNVTQCRSGSVNMELYETGVRMRQAGVVGGADITTEAAVTKMMYLLGKNLTTDEIRSCLKRSLRGEITD